MIQGVVRPRPLTNLHIIIIFLYSILGRQLLTVVDASKIELNPLGRGGSATPSATTNAATSNTPVTNSDDYK